MCVTDFLLWLFSLTVLILKSFWVLFFWSYDGGAIRVTLKVSLLWVPNCDFILFILLIESLIAWLLRLMLLLDYVLILIICISFSLWRLMTCGLVFELKALICPASGERKCSNALLLDTTSTWEFPLDKSNLALYLVWFIETRGFWVFLLLW